jgi:hypothetical protein
MGPFVPTGSGLRVTRYRVPAPALTRWRAGSRRCVGWGAGRPRASPEGQPQERAAGQALVFAPWARLSAALVHVVRGTGHAHSDHLPPLGGDGGDSLRLPAINPEKQPPHSHLRWASHNPSSPLMGEEEGGGEIPLTPALPHGGGRRTGGTMHAERFVSHPLRTHRWPTRVGQGRAVVIAAFARRRLVPSRLGSASHKGLPYLANGILRPPAGGLRMTVCVGFWASIAPPSRRARAS